MQRHILQQVWKKSHCVQHHLQLQTKAAQPWGLEASSSPDTTQDLSDTPEPEPMCPPKAGCVHKQAWCFCPGSCNCKPWERPEDAIRTVWLFLVGFMWSHLSISGSQCWAKMWDLAPWKSARCPAHPPAYLSDIHSHNTACFKVLVLSLPPLQIMS